MSTKLGKKVRRPGKGKNKKKKRRNKLSLLIGEDDVNDLFSNEVFSPILVIKEDEHLEQKFQNTFLSQSGTQITPKEDEYTKSEIKENTIGLPNSPINGSINNPIKQNIDIEIQKEYPNSNTSNTSDDSHDTFDNIEQIQTTLAQANDIDSSEKKEIINNNNESSNPMIEINNKPIDTQQINNEFEFEFKYENENENDSINMLLIHAKDIIEEFLKEDKPELEWRISEYLCRDEIVHLLLSYISRLPSYIHVRILNSIYINENNIAIKWINNTIYKTDELYIDKNKDKDDNDRHFLLCNEQNNIQNINDIIIEEEKISDSENENDNSSSDDIDQLFERNPNSDNKEEKVYFDKNNCEYFEKLSFSLMKILSNSYAPKTVKSFLLEKIEYIIFHSLLVFHPVSYGNIYHATEILNILLLYWPLQLFETLTMCNCIAIKYLFKYAIMSRIHQWKFSEFIINLLCYNNNSGNIALQTDINKYRNILINMLIKWNFLNNIISIGCNPIKYSEDISNKYCLFLFNLLKKCALIKEAKNIFSNPNNMLTVIVDNILKNVLNNALNYKWYKINCSFALKDVIKYLSKPTILQVINIPKSQGIIEPISSPNNMFSLIKDALNKFSEYIPLIIKEIIITNENKNDKRIGLHRLNCMELLMLYIDITKLENDNLIIPDAQILCKNLLDMVFIYDENNIFLAKFRTFINVINIHCINELEYMVIECKMIHRFMEYYNNKNNLRSGLHAYIMQILYEIYEYHEGLYDEDFDEEWNLVKYIKSDQMMIDFIEVINTEIDENEPDEDI